MPITMASLGPPGVPVVSLAVAAEDKNAIDAYIRHSVHLLFLGQVTSVDAGHLGASLSEHYRLPHGWIMVGTH